MTPSKSVYKIYFCLGGLWFNLVLLSAHSVPIEVFVVIIWANFKFLRIYILAVMLLSEFFFGLSVVCDLNKRAISKTFS